MTAWGIHRLADMIGSKNVAAQLPDKSWVRAVPEPFTGNRRKAAWTVLCGHAYAVEWPEPGDLEKALRLSEAQAAAVVNLKEADEIAIRSNSDWVGISPTARLILRSSQPARGAHRLRINPGPNIHNQDTALGITADAAFAAAPGKPAYGCLFWCVNAHPQQWMESPDDFLRGPDGKAIAKCSLANPLPAPVEVDYDCVVKGHYLQEAGRDAARLPWRQALRPGGHQPVVRRPEPDPDLPGAGCALRSTRETRRSDPSPDPGHGVESGAR